MVLNKMKPDRKSGFNFRKFYDLHAKEVSWRTDAYHCPMLVVGHNTVSIQVTRFDCPFPPDGIDPSRFNLVDVLSTRPISELEPWRYTRSLLPSPPYLYAAVPVNRVEKVIGNNWRILEKESLG